MYQEFWSISFGQHAPEFLGARTRQWRWCTTGINGAAELAAVVGLRRRCGRAQGKCPRLILLQLPRSLRSGTFCRPQKKTSTLCCTDRRRLTTSCVGATTSVSRKGVIYETSASVVNLDNARGPFYRGARAKFVGCGYKDSPKSAHARIP